MGAVPSTEGARSHDSDSEQDDKKCIIEKDDIKRRGSNRKNSSGETVDCPTCRGTGCIPRGNVHTHTHTHTPTSVY